MKLAYGFIETRGLIAAIEAADAMLKAAKVKLLKRQKIGSALVTVVVEGELAACQAAVNAGSAAAQRIGELVTAHVIPHPFADTETLVLDYLDGKRAKESSHPAEEDVIKTKPPETEVKKSKAEKSLSTRDRLFELLLEEKVGLTLNRIAEFLKIKTAEVRRLIKQLMDEGKIEKIQQKYFLINGGKRK